MPDADVVQWIHDKYIHLAPELDERGHRRWAAIEETSLGRGGIAAVAAATGISEKGRKVPDVELAECIIKRNKFHGDWNYEIHPRR